MVSPLQRGAASTASDVGGSSFTIVKDAAVVSGDLLVMWVSNGGAAATAAGLSVSGGATWNKYGTGVDNSGYGAGAWFWKFAGGSEPATYTVSYNGASAVAGLVAYQGGTVDPNPFPAGSIAYALDTGANATQVAVSVTGVNGGLLLRGYSNIANNQATPSFSSYSSPQVEILDANAGAGGYNGIALARQSLTASGATGDATATASSSRRQVTVSAAISPYTGPTYSPSASDTARAADAATQVRTSTRSPADVAAGADAAASTLGKAAGPDAAAGTDLVLITKGRDITGDTAGATGTTSFVQSMVRGPADALPIFEEVRAVLTHPEIVDFQFVFDAEPWVPFGHGQTVVVQNFNPGTSEARVQDQLSPVANVRRFGKDLKTPPTWSFDLYTDVEDASQAMGWAQVMEPLWDPDVVTPNPDDVVTLRYALAGRIRRVYGRPRNFVPVPTYVRTGRVDMVADFVLAEDTYYADAVSSVELRMRAATRAGGFTFPITFPLTTLTAPARNEQLVIGGTRPTWLDIVFQGPVVNPYVIIGSSRWALKGSLASGQSVTMTGQPWRAGLRRNDGAWVPGMLDPRARLSQLRLKPGVYTATFGGFAISSSARAVVSWRDAYGTL